MILKEPILEDGQKTPRLCPSGQWLITRSAMEIERQLLKNFTIVKHQDIRQFKKYDRQRIWFLRKRPFVISKHGQTSDDIGQDNSRENWNHIMKHAFKNCNCRKCQHGK